MSTVVFAAVLLFAVTSSPGWPRVRDSFFNLRIGWDSLPALLEGLWLNVRVLIVCQVLILDLRTRPGCDADACAGPVWFPLRALATGYVDLFRGLPLLICLYLVGFGLPGLRLSGLPTNPVLLGGLALVLIYSAYVAEVFRAGIESVHPSQLAAAKSLGLNHRRTMRLVVLPQATRRVTPALLNDFVALQKDCGLISVLGAVDAVRAAQIQAATTYNFTPYVVAGLLFVALAVPSARLADWAAKRVATRQGATVTDTPDPVLSVRGLTKAYHDRPVLNGIDLDVAEHQVVVLIGASGSGKSTLLRCIDLLEDIDDGQILLDGRDISDPRIDADEARQAMGMVFQSFNLFPHMTALANVALAPRVVHGSTPPGRPGARPRTVGPGRAGLTRGRLPGQAVRRSAAAGGHRPRAGLRPATAAARRDHQRAGPRTGRRGAGPRRRVGDGSGRTIVMATHEMAFAREVADTVCFLDGGRIVESGSAAKVLTDPQRRGPVSSCSASPGAAESSARSGRSSAQAKEPAATASRTNPTHQLASVPM